MSRANLESCPRFFGMLIPADVSEIHRAIGEMHSNEVRGPGPPVTPTGVYNFGSGGTLGHGTGRSLSVQASITQ